MGIGKQPLLLFPQVVSSFPHIVGFRDAFLSNEFGGAAALYLVYDFHPKAATVEKVYIRTSSRTPVPEDVMWSFAIQVSRRGEALVTTCLGRLPSLG